MAEHEKSHEGHLNHEKHSHGNHVNHERNANGHREAASSDPEAGDSSGTVGQDASDPADDPVLDDTIEGGA